MSKRILEKLFVKIKWLRVQPESVKVKYIWIFTFIILAIVFLLQFVIFKKYKIDSIDNIENIRLIEDVDKIKKNIENKIKEFDIDLLKKEVPLASPE